MSEKEPRAKKQKAPKAVKAKPVKIMSDELDKLKLAADTLERLIKAKEDADLAEIRLEQEQDQVKNLKGAASAARQQVNDIIEAWKRPLPLFDAAEKKPAAKPDEKPAVDLSGVKIRTTGKHQGMAVGAEAQVVEVYLGGVKVEYDGKQYELLDEEYNVTPEAKAIIEAARKPQHPAFVEPSTDWRNVPIENVGFPPKVALYLQSANIATVGAFSDWQKQKGDFWDRDLQVGGERKPNNFRQHIKDGMAAFWASRQPAEATVTVSAGGESVTVPFSTVEQLAESVGA